MFQRTIIGILSLLIVWLATFGNQSSFEGSMDNDVDVPVAEIPVSDQDESSQDAFKIVAYEAVIPLVHASVSVILYCFIKIQSIFETFTEVETEFELPFLSYFNTLFRLIISPNAP